MNTFKKSLNKTVGSSLLAIFVSMFLVACPSGKEPTAPGPSVPGGSGGAPGAGLKPSCDLADVELCKAGKADVDPAKEPTGCYYNLVANECMPKKKTCEELKLNECLVAEALVADAAQKECFHIKGVCMGDKDKKVSSCADLEKADCSRENKYAAEGAQYGCLSATSKKKNSVEKCWKVVEAAGDLAPKVGCNNPEMAQNQEYCGVPGIRADGKDCFWEGSLGGIGANRCQNHVK